MSKPLLHIRRIAEIEGMPPVTRHRQVGSSRKGCTALIGCVLARNIGTIRRMGATISASGDAFLLTLLRSRTAGAGGVAELESTRFPLRFEARRYASLT